MGVLPRYVYLQIGHRGQWTIIFKLVRLVYIFAKSAQIYQEDLMNINLYFWGLWNLSRSKQEKTQDKLDIITYHPGAVDEPPQPARSTGKTPKVVFLKVDLPAPAVVKGKIDLKVTYLKFADDQPHTQDHLIGREEEKDKDAPVSSPAFP